MSNAPRQPTEPCADHAVVQASRRAVVARARFDRELDALIEAIHTARERWHGHRLPHEHDGATGEHGDDQ